MAIVGFPYGTSNFPPNSLSEINGDAGEEKKIESQRKNSTIGYD
jgi:hypothetical protein